VSTSEVHRLDQVAGLRLGMIGKGQPLQVLEAVSRIFREPPSEKMAIHLPRRTGKIRPATRWRQSAHPPVKAASTGNPARRRG
jgi:hypothetical protein